MKNRILSMLLAVLMVVSLAPITAFAGGNPVNIVGGSSYANVQNAVDNATNGQTIQLNTTCTENVTIPAGLTVTIDLNGNVLRGPGTGSVITVESGATLTITDSTPNAVHKFIVGTDGLWTLDETSGTETVSGGVITGGTGTTSGSELLGGGVYVASSGVLVMNGGTIAGCSAQKGGGVFTWGNMTMNNDSRIVGCTATVDGGGVCACNCTVTMNGSSKVSDCTAGNGAGGVYIFGGSNAPASFTMNDNSTISDCISSAKYPSNRRSGGGVCVEGNSCTFTMNGGSICRNNGAAQVNDGCGGSVNVYSGAFTMNGGSITGNTATTYCAGVFVNSGATFTMTGDSVISNNNGGQGAGVYLKGAFTMSGNSQITGNTGTMGGGVGIVDGTFAMSGSSNITYNTGTGGTGVGGVYIKSGTFTMTGGSIGHNTGGYAGGVLANVDITLGGTAKITDNVKGGTISDGVLAGGTASNVYLPNDKYITLGTEDNAPTEGMSVGVTTQTSPTGENSVVFTGNCVIYTDKYFFSDNLNYCVRDVRSSADTGHLELSGKYDLWVNNIQVTVGNKNDVLGEADEDGATVTYDNATKTLTLNGARFANGNDVLDYKWGVKSSIDELTVVLKGHNEIGSYFGGPTGSADETKYSIGEGFDCGELLQFVGDGSLTIYDSQAGIRAGNVEFGTEDEPFAGKVTIIDCGYVEPPEPEPPCAISAIDSVTINGGTFNLTSYTSNGIAAENININGCTEIKVKGAVNGEGAHAVNANTSLTIGDTLEVINSTYTKNETKSLDPTDGNKNDGYVIIRPKAAPPVSFNITNGTPESDKETNHGYITIDKTTASEGETVTITVNPAEGYKLKDDSLNVRKTVTAGPHGLPITLMQDTQDKTKYTFTMPAYAVTVMAEFEKIPDAELIAAALAGTSETSIPGVMDITVDILGTRTVKLLKNIDMGNKDVTVAENVFLDFNHFALTTTGKLTNNGVIILHQENADIVEDLLYKVPGNYAADEELKLPTDENPDYVIPAKTFMTSEVGTNPAYQELSFASGDDMLVWNKDVTAGVQIDVAYSLTLGGDIIGAKGSNVKPTKVTATNVALNDNITIGGNNGEGEASLVIESIPGDDLFPETVGTFTANGKKITLGKSGKLVISSNIDFDESVLVSGAAGMTVVKTENKTDGTVTYFIETLHTHAPVLVNGQAATKETAGWKDYYKCDCGKFFEDATCKVEITDLDAWKAEGGNGYIAKIEEEPKSPQTGDNSHMSLWVMLMALSSMGLCACLVLGKKRRYSK